MGIRVLVVEDDVMNQALARAVLARAEDAVLRGAEVEVAGSVAAARAVLGSGWVDVVLLDLGLPDGDGLVLAGELAKHGGCGAVVAVTGAAAETAAAARAAGCAAVVSKPYRAAELCDVVSRAVAARRSG